MGDNTDEWYRSAARSQYGRAGHIEFDAEAPVSNGADKGAYVQAWVWVEDQEEEDE